MLTHRLNGHKILLGVDSHRHPWLHGRHVPHSGWSSCAVAKLSTNVGTVSCHGVVPSTQRQVMAGHGESWRVMAGHGESAGQRSQFSQDDSDLKKHSAGSRARRQMHNLVRVCGNGPKGCNAAWPSPTSPTGPTGTRDCHNALKSRATHGASCQDGQSSGTCHVGGPRPNQCFDWWYISGNRDWLVG